MNFYLPSGKSVFVSGFYINATILPCYNPNIENKSEENG